jgi:hypothetical protein
MRVLFILTAIVLTASAQAKIVSVQCQTGPKEDDQSSMALSFDDSSPGPFTPLQSLTFGGRDAMEPGREKGYGFKVSGVGKMDIHVDVSPIPDYLPYNHSYFEVSVSHCETGAGFGQGTYFHNPYRSPMVRYAVTCDCSSQ